MLTPRDTSKSLHESGLRLRIKLTQHFYLCIITARKRSCRKVMFLHLAVMLLTVWGGGSTILPWDQTPLGPDPPGGSHDDKRKHRTMFFQYSSSLSYHPLDIKLKLRYTSGIVLDIYSPLLAQLKARGVI